MENVRIVHSIDGLSRTTPHGVDDDEAELP
jgi:hypothetical protein